VPPAPTPSPPAPEVLSGTFTVVCGEPPPPTPAVPNEVFLFTITGVNFQTPSGLTVIGVESAQFGCYGQSGLGCMEALTFDQLRVYMSLVVSINGERVEMGGAGFWQGSSSWPTFENIEICGTVAGPPGGCEAIHLGASGYGLKIFAQNGPR